jgi:hypothetical protein
MHAHELLHYTIIQQFGTESPICLANVDTHLASTYNRISTLIHYLMPFFIQVVSITLLIILAARSRAKTNGKQRTYSQILVKQFKTQKELYITPMIIIFSAIPQIIITFNLACTELANWQRHILLSAYLFSCAPQVLGYILYVLPSTSYKEEFNETLLARKYLKWISGNKTK